MDYLTPLLVGIGLAMDCFAVSIAIGATRAGRRIVTALIIGLAFGGFQGGMTLLGWIAGEALIGIVERFAPVIAFALLTFIGVRMIHEGLEDEPSGVVPNALNILPIVVLSFATSIDALAVGFTFAALAMEIAISSLIIAIVSFIFSVFGVLLGDRLAGILGRKVEIVGGAVLIIIGMRILLQSFLI